MKKLDINWPLIFLILLIVFFIFGDLYKSYKEALIEKQEEIENAISMLDTDCEDYNYKDKEIPYVYICSWPSTKEDSIMFVSVRFYDKFDNYSKSEKQSLIQQYNVFFSNQASFIVSHSEFYKLSDSNWNIEISYDTNDNEYSEYKYTGTLN